MKHLPHEQMQSAENYWREIFSTHWFPTQLRTPDSSNLFHESVNVKQLLSLDEQALMERFDDKIPKHNILLASWLITLMHLTDSEQQMISVQLDSAVLPIAVDLDTQASLIEIAELVAQKSDEAQKFQHYPFIELAQQEFAIPTYAENILTPIAIGLEKEATDVPLALTCRAKNGATEFVIKGKGEFADAAFLQQLMICFHTVLVNGLACDIPISQLEILPRDVIEQLLQQGKAAEAVLPNELRIDALFSSVAQAYPELTAVTFKNASLTYSELEKASGQLSSNLNQLEIREQDIVAVLMPRNIGMVVTMLATLKSKAVYMPIDPAYPVDRIRFMLEDCGATCVFLGHEERKKLPDEIIKYILVSNRTILVVDEQAQVVEVLKGEQSRHKSRARSETAYLMYTSGTTGSPKGVLCTHQGAIRLVRNTNFVQLGTNTRMLQAGATGFDATVFEIWGALLNGGTLQIVERNVLLDAQALGDFLLKNKSNTALMATSLFSQLASDKPEIFASFDQLCVGGDIIPAQQVRDVYSACPDAKIINVYGPTENSVLSTTELVSRDENDGVSIGRAINNSTSIILNKFSRMIPPLFQGELCVGGKGLATGYLNRDEDTARSFIPHPYEKKRRLYRTGDHARINKLGKIDFLGRRDYQIKVRGFRVELGEIEKTILTLPYINEVLVTAEKPEGALEYQLRCYIGVTDLFSLEEFRHCLVKLLPVHMVPAVIIPMLELPLTVNGKIDRVSLAKLELEQTATKPVYADSIEESLTEICQALLRLPVIHVQEDLKQLGASSLTAAILTARISKVLGIRLPVAEVIERKTIAELAVLVKLAQQDTSRNCDTSFIQAHQGGGGIPVSPQQERLFIEQSKSPDATHYNLPLLIKLSNSVTVAELESAFQLLVSKHDILRTQFVREGSETTQVILDKVEVKIQPITQSSNVFSALSGFIQSFDLGKGPLWRIANYDAPDGQYLFFDIHHILTDGYSLTQLMQQWAAVYNGELLPKTQLQYGDYALWLQSKAGQEYLSSQEIFWQEMYADMSEFPDLPIDYPRSDIRSINSEALEFEFGNDRTYKILAMTEQMGISRFQFLIACYGIFLAQVTGGNDVTVGTPVLGRLVPLTDEIQGMFVNTLCLRLQLQDKQTFSEYQESVIKLTKSALNNQDYPFNRLVEKLIPNRLFGRSPLFDSMFALQNTGLNQTSFLGGSITWSPSATSSTIYDLNLQIEDEPKNLTAGWYFNSDLFVMETIQLFKERYLEIIDQVLANPDISIHSLNQFETTEQITLPEIEFNF